MKIATSITLAVAAAAGVAAEDDYSKPPTECVDSLYLIVVRGTGEDPGLGRVGGVAKNISAGIEGSRILALDYPATLSDPSYNDSVKNGTVALTNAVDDYYKICPDGKVGVLGYSQGGQVSTSVFCGVDEDDFKRSELPTEIVKNVVAIVAIGDPSHVANTTYDKGTSKKDGIFAASEKPVKVCEAIGSKLRSYCDTGDVYCDVGHNEATHATYFGTYGKEITDFVIDQYKEAGSDANSTSTSTSASSTNQPSSTSTNAATSGGASQTADAGSSASWMQPGLVLVYAMPLAVLGIWETL